MRIKKFNKINEEVNETYYIFVDEESPWYEGTTYLFNNQDDLNNFFSNKIYTIFQKNCEKTKLDEALGILDDCENAEEIIEFLSNTIDNSDILGDYDTKIYYETVNLDQNIKLEDWIKLRRDSKRYNL